MTSELTNLLSADRIRAFRRYYFMRLGTLALFVIATLVVVHGILLMPSYFYAKEQSAIHTAHLGEIAAASEREGGESIAARFGSLNENASRALKLLAAPSASAAIRSVLALPRPGITVKRFTFAAPTASRKEGKMTVSGVAATRDALREYHVALQSLSFVEAAELPLGAYANEREIPFVITLSGSLQP